LGRPLTTQARIYLSLEIRWLTIVTIVLTVLTTCVFPFWPEDVNVGGWALWGLGGWISSVMEYGARNWPLEVLLGGLALLVEIYMVLASNWFREPLQRMQLMVACSMLLIIHNVAVFSAFLALWVLVVLIWAVIIAVVVTAIAFLLKKWIEAR
jgi:hypothetical protein